MSQPADFPPDPGLDLESWFRPANPYTMRERPMPEHQRRDIRETAITVAGYLAPDADNLGDAESDARTAERAVAIAKRFEQFIVDGL